jgi:anti-sigma regulatory factor (Ser/Thr protein kinase)
MDSKIENEEDILMEIQCSVRGEILPIMRNFVASVAQNMGFSRDEISKIEMSVDEACSNVLRHAYFHNGASEQIQRPEHQDPQKGHMKICVRAASDHLQITICDKGLGIKGKPYKGVENIDEFLHKCHGLGTYIIHKFMDKVVIEYPEGCGTTVSMIKYLHSQT